MQYGCNIKADVKDEILCVKMTQTICTHLYSSPAVHFLPQPFRVYNLRMSFNLIMIVAMSPQSGERDQL